MKTDPKSIHYIGVDGAEMPTPEQRAIHEQRARDFAEVLNKPNGAMGELMAAVSTLLYGKAVMTYGLVNGERVPVLAQMIQEEGSVRIVPMLASAGALKEMNLLLPPVDTPDDRLVVVQMPRLQMMVDATVAVMREDTGMQGCGDPDCANCNPDGKAIQAKATAEAADALAKAKRAPDGSLPH